MLLGGPAPREQVTEPLSRHPVAKEDLALVVDAAVPAAAVEADQHAERDAWQAKQARITQLVSRV